MPYIQKQDTTNPLVENDTITDAVGVNKEEVVNADGFNPKVATDSLVTENAAPTDSLNAASDSLETDIGDDEIAGEEVKGKVEEESTLNDFKFVNLLMKFRNNAPDDNAKLYFNDLIIDPDKRSKYMDMFETSPELRTSVYNDLGKLLSGDDSANVYKEYQMYGNGVDGLNNYLHDGKKLDEDKQQKFKKVELIQNAVAQPKDVSYETSALKDGKTTDELKLELSDLENQVIPKYRYSVGGTTGIATQSGVDPQTGYTVGYNEAAQAIISKNIDKKTQEIRESIEDDKDNDAITYLFTEGNIKNFAEPNSRKEDSDGNILELGLNYQDIYLNYLERNKPNQYLFLKSKLDFLNSDAEDFQWTKPQPLIGRQGQIIDYAKPSDEELVKNWIEGKLSQKEIYNNFYRTLMPLPDSVGENDVKEYLVKTRGYTEGEVDLIFHAPADFSKESLLEEAEHELNHLGLQYVLGGLAKHTSRLADDFDNYGMYVEGLAVRFEADKEKYTSMMNDLTSKFYNEVDGEMVLKPGVQENEQQLLEHNKLVEKLELFASESTYNDESANELTQAYNLPILNEYGNHSSLLSFLVTEQSEINKEFPNATRSLSRAQKISQVVKEDYSRAQKNIQLNDKLKAEGKTREERKKILGENWNYFNDKMTQAAAAMGDFAWHWSKAVRNLDQWVGDSSVYDEDDYEADTYHNLYEQSTHNTEVYKEPLFENRVEILVPDEEGNNKSYFITIRDDGTPMDYAAVKSDDGLYVEQRYQKPDEAPGLYEVVIDAYKKGLEEGKEFNSELYRNPNMTFKTVKLLADLSVQVAITRGMGFLMTPVIAGGSKIAQTLAKAKFLRAERLRGVKLMVPKMGKAPKITKAGQKGRKTMLPDKNIQSFTPRTIVNEGQFARGMSKEWVGRISGYSGINTAITLQTYNEFYKGAQEAGYYGNADKYALAQTQVIGLINMINPNVKLYAGHKNVLSRFIARVTGMDKPGARFASRMRAGWLGKTANTLRQGFTNKGIGAMPKLSKFLREKAARQNGATKLQIRENLALTLTGSVSESFEEWAELYGEYGVNRMTNLLANDSYAFRLKDLPSAAMQFESLLLGAIGGGVHKLTDAVPPMLGFDHKNSQIEREILADFINNEEEYIEVIEKNIGNTVYLPTGSNLVPELTKDKGLVVLTKNAADKIIQGLKGFAYEVKKVTPVGASEATIMMLTSLVENRILTQRLVDNAQTPEMSNLFQVVLDNINTDIEGIQNGTSLISPESRKPISKNTMVSGRAVVRVDGSPINPSDFMRRISLDENGKAVDPKFREDIITDKISIFVEYLPPKTTKVLADVLRQRRKYRKDNPRKKVAAQGLKGPQGNVLPGFLFVGPGEDVQNTDFGGNGRTYTEYNENAEMDIKDDGAQNRRHIALPIGGFLQITEVDLAGSKKIQGEKIYFRFKTPNGEKEVRLFYEANVTRDADGNIKKAVPVGFATSAEVIESTKKDGKVESKKKKININFTKKSTKPGVDRENDVDYDVSSNEAAISLTLGEALEQAGMSLNTKLSHSNQPIFLDVFKTPQETFEETLLTHDGDYTTMSDDALASYLIRAARFYGNDFSNATGKVLQEIEYIKDEILKRHQNAGTNQQTTTTGAQAQPTTTSTPTTPTNQTQGTSKPTGAKKTTTKPKAKTKPVTKTPKQRSTATSAKSQTTTPTKISKEVENAKYVRELTQALSIDQVKKVRDAILGKGVYAKKSLAVRKRYASPKLKDVGISFDRAVEMLADENALKSLSNEVLDTVYSFRGKAKNKKGIEQLINQHNIGYKNATEVVNEVFRSFQTDQLTKEEAREYIFNVWSEYLNAILNPKMNIISKKANLEKLNAIVNFYENGSKQKIQMLEQFQKTMVHLKKQHPITSLQGLKNNLAEIGVTVSKLLSNDDFWGRNKMYDESSYSTQNYVKKQIRAMAKRLGVDSIIEFDSDVVTNFLVDNDGNVIRRRRDKVESQRIERFKQDLKTIFSSPEFNDSNSYTGVEFGRRLNHAFKHGNIAHPNSGTISLLKALGVQGEIFGVTKNTKSAVFKKIINDALNLEIQYTEVLRKPAPLEMKKGVWVGLKVDSKKSGVNSYVDENGAIGDVIYFNNFSQTQIGGTLRIKAFDTTVDGETIRYAVLEQISSTSVRVLRKIDNTEKSLAIDELLDLANETAQNQYNNLPSNGAGAKKLDAVIEQNDGFKELTIHKSQKNVDINEEDGTFKYDDEGKKVKFRTLVNADGDGVFLEINPQEELTKQEFFRVLRFAKKQGATNIAVRGKTKVIKQASSDDVYSHVGDFSKKSLYGTDGDLNKTGPAANFNVLTDIFSADKNASFMNDYEHNQLMAVEHGFSPSGISQQNGGLVSPNSLYNTYNYVGGFGRSMFTSLQGASLFLDSNLSEHPKMNIDIDAIFRDGSLSEQEKVEYEKIIDEVNKFLFSNSVDSFAFKNMVSSALYKSIKQNNLDVNDLYQNVNINTEGIFNPTKITLPFNAQLTFTEILSESLTKFRKAMDTEILINMIRQNEIDKSNGVAPSFTSAQLNQYISKDMIMMEEVDFMPNDIYSNNVYEPFKFNKVDISKVSVLASQAANSKIDNEIDGTGIRDLNTARQLRFVLTQIESLQILSPDYLSVNKTRLIQKVEFEPDPGNRVVDFNSNIDEKTTRQLLYALKTSKKKAELARVLASKLSGEMFNELKEYEGYNYQKVELSEALKNLTNQELYSAIVELSTDMPYDAQLNPGNVDVNRFFIKKLKISGTKTNTSNGEVLTRFDVDKDLKFTGEGYIRNRVLDNFIKKEEGGAWNPFSGKITLNGAETSSIDGLSDPTTLVHEMAHIWVRLAKGRYGDKINKIFDLIEKSNDPEVVAYRQIVNSLYSASYNNPAAFLYYNNDRALTEEVFVQMIAHNVVERLITDKNSTVSKILDSGWGVIKGVFATMGFTKDAVELQNMTLEGLMNDVVENEFIYNGGKFDITRKINDLLREGAGKLSEKNLTSSSAWKKNIIPRNWYAKRLTYDDLGFRNYIENVNTKSDNEKFGMGLAMRNPLYFFADKSDYNSLGKAGLYVKLYILDRRARLRDLEAAIKRAGNELDDSIVDSYVLQDGKVKQKQDLVISQILTDFTGKRQSLLERLEDDVFDDIDINRSPRAKKEAMNKLMYALQALYINKKGFEETTNKYFESRKNLRAEIKVEENAFKEFLEAQRDINEKNRNTPSYKAKVADDIIITILDAGDVEINRLIRLAKSDNKIDKLLDKHFKTRKELVFWDSTSKKNVKLRNEIISYQQEILDVLKAEDMTQNEQYEKIGEIRAKILKAAKEIPDTAARPGEEFAFPAISVASSGMTNEQAQEIITKLGGKVNTKTKDGIPTADFQEDTDGAKLMTYIEEFHDSVNRSSLENMRSSGYIDESSYNDLSKNKYYVPLNVDMNRLGEDLHNIGVTNPDEDTYNIAESKNLRLKTKDRLFEQREYLDKYIFDGRFDVINNSLVRYFQTLYRIEENDNRRKLGRLLSVIQDNVASDRFIQLADKIKINKMSEDPNFSGLGTANIKKTVQKTRPSLGSTAIKVTDKLSNDRGIVTVPYREVDGSIKYMEVYDSSLAVAFLDNNSNQKSDTAKLMLAVGRSVNNMLRGAYVGYNIMFTQRNNIRDAEAVMITTAGFTDAAAKKIAKETFGQLMQSPFGILGAILGAKGKNNSLLSIYSYKTGKYSDEELASGKSWANYYEMAKSAGAEISWVGETQYEQFLSNMEGLIRENSVKGLNGALNITDPLSVLPRVLDWINTVNSSVENNYRLVVFKNAYEEMIKPEHGLTEQQAISKAAVAAKYVTLNFEDKGLSTQYLNTYKLFFNAAAQGTYMIYRYSKNPRVRRMMTYMAATGALNRFLVDHLIASSDDEEFKEAMLKIGDYEFNNNMVIPLTNSMRKKLKTDKWFVAIPLPYGYNSFKYLGDVSYRDKMTKQYNSENQSYHYYVPSDVSKTKIMTSFVSSMFPIAVTGTSIEQIVSPTQIMPFVNNKVNKNFMGTPVYLDTSAYGPENVASQTSRKNTPSVYKSMAQIMNYIGGGDVANSSWLDAHPEEYREIIRHYAGGFFATMAEDTFEGLMQLGRIPSDVSEKNVTNGFKNNTLNSMHKGAEWLFQPFIKEGRSEDNLKSIYYLHNISKKKLLPNDDVRYYNDVLDRYESYIGTEKEVMNAVSIRNMRSEMSKAQRLKLGYEHLFNLADKGEVSDIYSRRGSDKAIEEKLRSMNNDEKNRIKTGYYKGLHFIDPVVVSPKEDFNRDKEKYKEQNKFPETIHTDKEIFGYSNEADSVIDKSYKDNFFGRVSKSILDRFYQGQKIDENEN